VVKTLQLLFFAKKKWIRFGGKKRCQTTATWSPSTLRSARSTRHPWQGRVVYPLPRGAKPRTRLDRDVHGAKPGRGTILVEEAKHLLELRDLLVVELVRHGRREGAVGRRREMGNGRGRERVGSVVSLPRINKVHAQQWGGAAAECDGEPPCGAAEAAVHRAKAAFSSL
jgi:hypothetical protein